MVSLALRRYVIAVSLLVFGSLPAAAQDGGRVQEMAQICAACHGEAGVPQERTTPIIWGQHQGYLYLQLRDYKKGDRQHDLMTPVAEPLERTDMLALADYFARKPWPRSEQPAAADDVTLRAARADTAVGCTGCHQDYYKGEGTQPRLAGQNREYLLKSMLDLRTGARGNNPGMTTLMKATSENDIADLAEYLAGLRLPQ